MYEVKVYVLKGAGPFPTIPADCFFGAVNLDTGAQTAHVNFYGAANAYDASSIIATANALAVGGFTPTMQLPSGIAINERYLSMNTDAAITGLGIAVYYGVKVH